jgi:hypothetical protein
MTDTPIPRPPAGEEGNAPKVQGSPWLTEQTGPPPQEVRR